MHERTDPRDDQALIAAINEGDFEAFAVLYDRYKEWIANLAGQFTGDPHLALDVLQETFRQFLAKFPGFVLTAQLKTYFYPMVRHISLNLIQKTRRLQSSEAEQALLDTWPDESRVEDSDTVVAALALLPAEQRETLRLRFVEDFSLEEIAEVLEIPLGTVKSRLHNALKTLRHDPRAREIFF